ncbi:Zinc finger CCCH domain-containing protein 4 [Nowakowskiella sp. JEL0078]|nr:Zinc finger CCCH domain-containing protein 4 [Nowakowskiella sp. JEL0078]
MPDFFAAELPDLEDLLFSAMTSHNTVNSQKNINPSSFQTKKIPFTKDFDTGISRTPNLTSNDETGMETNEILDTAAFDFIPAELPVFAQLNDTSPFSFFPNSESEIATESSENIVSEKIESSSVHIEEGELEEGELSCDEVEFEGGLESVDSTKVISIEVNEQNKSIGNGWGKKKPRKRKWVQKKLSQKEEQLLVKQLKKKKVKVERIEGELRALQELESDLLKGVDAFRNGEPVSGENKELKKRQTNPFSAVEQMLAILPDVSISGTTHNHKSKSQDPTNFLGMSLKNRLIDRKINERRERQQAAKEEQLKLLPCHRWMKGRCDLGEKCTFGHLPEYFNVSPSLSRNPVSKTQICKFYLKGACTKSGSCPFSHDKSAVPCEHFNIKGFCTRSDCEFSHGEITEQRKEQLIEEWKERRKKFGSQMKKVG